MPNILALASYWYLILWPSNDPDNLVKIEWPVHETREEGTARLKECWNMRREADADGLYGTCVQAHSGLDLWRSATRYDYTNPGAQIAGDGPWDRKILISVAKDKVIVTDMPETGPSVTRHWEHVE